LPIAKFVVFAHRCDYANPKGKSDLDAAYPHFTAKTSLLNAWKAHLERFASPTMLASAGSGASHKERDAMLSGLNSLATAKALVFPSDFEVSSIPAATEASKGFMDAIDYHNREIARAILGQTLTTDEGRRVGSLALGRVHLQVLLLQLESIRKDLADRVMTEQVIRPLVEINFGLGNVPRFEFESADVEAFRSGRLD
jgi:phage gp29-like protein